MTFSLDKRALLISSFRTIINIYTLTLGLTSRWEKSRPLPNRSRTGQFLESKRGDKSNRTLANNNVAIVQRRCFYHDDDDDDQDDDHDHDLLNLRQQLCQQQSLHWFIRGSRRRCQPSREMYFGND